MKCSICEHFEVVTVPVTVESYGSVKKREVCLACFAKEYMRIRDWHQE